MVVVYVGPHDQIFRIHLEFLSKIPHLEKICSRRASESDNAYLPLEKPNIFQHVMVYIYRDQLPELSPESTKDECIQVMETHLLALRLGMEDLANQLITSLHLYQGMVRGSNVRELVLVQGSDVLDCPLRRLLLRSLAEIISEMGWKAYFKERRALLAFLAGDGLLSLDLAKAIHTHKDLPELCDDEDVCQWHQHDVTPKCKDRKRKRRYGPKKRKVDG